MAYDGSSYSGFAEQPGQTTVAGELRRAIETLLRRPIELTCAMRTDSGDEVAFGEDTLTFTIEGNAFLHSMVRTIVGTLAELVVLD